MILGHNKIVNLFLISVVLGSGLGYSHIYLFHICLVILIGSWVATKIIGQGELFIKPVIGLRHFFLWMLLWYALGLSWSIEQSYTLRYLSYIVFGVAVVYVVTGRIYSEQSYHSVYAILKSVFVAEIVVALVEIFTPFRLPTSPYSEYAGLFGRSATDFSSFEGGTVKYIKSMPTGFRGNPNNLAVVMAALLPFFLFSPKKLVKMVGTLAILVIIVMAGSRGAFIGALLAIVLYMALVHFKPFLIMLLVGFFALSALIAGLDQLKMSKNPKVVEFAQTIDVVAEYLSEKENSSSNSISVRQQLIKNGLDALYETGGLGVGGGGSTAVQERQVDASLKITSMHNFWVEVLVDGGIGFFLTFVIWYLVVTIRLLLIFRRTLCPFYQYHAGALFTAFTVFGVACISASSVIYLLPMWLMFGMGLGLINAWELRCLLEAADYMDSQPRQVGMAVS